MLKQAIGKVLKEVYDDYTEEQLNKVVHIIERYALLINYDKLYTAFSFKEMFHGSFRSMRNRLEIFILKQREDAILLSIEKKDLNKTINLLEELFKEII